MFGWSVLLLTCVIAFIWHLITPPFSDDVVYRYTLDPSVSIDYWSVSGQPIENLSQIFSTVKNHFVYCNGRLSNVAYLLCQLLPLRFIKLLAATFMMLFAGAFWQWAGAKSLRNDLMSVVIALFFWVTLQWNEQMQSSDFQFNYSAASWMMILLAVQFIRNGNRTAKWAWLLLVIFALWHEGFAIALGCMLGVEWLYTRNRKLFMACCILLAGIAIQFLSGMVLRMGYSSAHNSGILGSQLGIMILKSAGSVIALIFWLIRRRQLSGNERCKIDRFGIGLTLSWIVTIAMYSLYHLPQRAHWPNDVLAILLVIMLVKTYRPISFYSWIKYLLIFIYMAWGWSLISYENRISRIIETIQSEFSKGNNIIPDSLNLTSSEVPFWLMQIPQFLYGSFVPAETLSFMGCAGKNLPNGWIIQNADGETDFNAVEKVGGNTDFKKFNLNYFVRRKDGVNLIGRKVIIEAEKPTLALTPLNFLISLCKGKVTNPTEILFITTQQPFVMQGDTLEFIGFSGNPLTLRGREIKAVDFID